VGRWLAAAHHALMAGTMGWMVLLAVAAAHRHPAATAAALLGGYFLLATPIWITVAVVRRGRWGARCELAGHAAMSAAMAAMLLVHG
jgi:hypothetical protein